MVEIFLKTPNVPQLPTALSYWSNRPLLPLALTLGFHSCRV